MHLNRPFVPGRECLLDVISTCNQNLPKNELATVVTLADLDTPVLQQKTLDRPHLVDIANLLQKATCAACMDYLMAVDIAQATCNHFYSLNFRQSKLDEIPFYVEAHMLTFVTVGIETSLAAKQLLTCCKRRIPIDILKTMAIHPLGTVENYAAFLEEYDPPNPMYCAHKNCGEFAPPCYVRGDNIECWKCK